MHTHTVVVVGGGTMGAGIAQAMLGVVRRVTVVEADPAACEPALERVRAGLARQFKRADDITAQALLFESDEKVRRMRAFLDRPKRS